MSAYYTSRSSRYYSYPSPQSSHSWAQRNQYTRAPLAHPWAENTCVCSFESQNPTTCERESFEDIEATFPKERLYFFSTHATQRYSDVNYEPGSVLIFGRETSGLDQEIHDNYKDRFVLIPKTDKVRSLNLSNAAAVAVYEAMRQLDWEPMGL